MNFGFQRAQEKKPIFKNRYWLIKHSVTKLIGPQITLASGLKYTTPINNIQHIYYLSLIKDTNNELILNKVCSKAIHYLYLL